MCIFIGSDHNGNAMRFYILKLLERRGFVKRTSMKPGFLGDNDFVDVCEALDGKIDYPVIAVDVCRRLKEYNKFGDYGKGILICGTGTGMSIVANRFKGIRAALVTDRVTAELSREHNNANVLVLGQWRTPLGDVDKILETWLDTPFAEGRHVERLKMIEKIRGAK